MSYSLPAGLGVAIMRAIEEAGYELVPKGQPRQVESKCCMLALNGDVCILERFHKNEHKSVSGYTWKGGQPTEEIEL